MRKRVLFFVTAGVIALVTACSDEPKRPPVDDSSSSPRIGGGGAGGGGGASDGGALDGGSSADAGDAGACTDVPVTGATIPQQVATGDVPAGTGGTIADGTYEITEAVLYGGAAALPGPSGASYQGAIRIAGQSFERHVIFKSAGGAIAETSTKGTFTVNGANGIISLTCPVATQEQVTYTASGNSLVISNLVTKDSLGFTRKP